MPATLSTTSFILKVSQRLLAVQQPSDPRGKKGTQLFFSSLRFNPALHFSFPCPLSPDPCPPPTAYKCLFVTTHSVPLAAVGVV